MKKFTKENAVSIKSIMRVENNTLCMTFLVDGKKWETPHEIELSWGYSNTYFKDITSGEECISPYKYDKWTKTLSKCFDVIDDAVNYIEKRQSVWNKNKQAA